MSAALDIAGLLRTVLVMSLAGSALTILLCLSGPLLRDRLPKAVQYYMWLAVLAALIVPFSRLVVLPARPVPGGGAVTLTPIHDAVSQGVFTVEEEMDRLTALPSGAGKAEIRDMQSGLSGVVTVLAVIWPLGALTFFAFNLAGYLMFVRRLKKSAVPVGARELELLKTLTGKRRAPRLYRAALAGAPMLTGLLRPAIVLPEREYSDAQLRCILLHELTHLYRRDIAVKWLSVLAGALHWFNPLVLLARRGLDLSCELACDEAVIRGLDTVGRQGYGDTLIAAAAGRGGMRTELSATMCDEKRILKERLGAIMKHKKFSVRTIIVSCVLLAVIVSAAVLLGAASGVSEGTDIPESTDLPAEYTPSAQPDISEPVYVPEPEPQIAAEPEADTANEPDAEDYADTSVLPLLWPAPGHDDVVSRFGVRVHPIYNIYRSHDGIDIRAPEGSEIIAAGSGTVIELGENATDGYFIWLDHGEGRQTFYAQLSGFADDLAPGVSVPRGGVIGYAGSTGDATGSHLHFGVCVDGVWMNPLMWYQQA